MSLRDVSTEDLVKEIINRQGIRSIEVTEEEFHKTQVSGSGEKRLRYLKGYGPGIVIEVTKNDI
jgi:hypothetical protein